MGLDPGKLGKEPAPPPNSLYFFWLSPFRGTSRSGALIPPNIAGPLPSLCTDPVVRQVLQGPGGPVPPLSYLRSGRWPTGAGEGAGGTDPSQLLL